MYWNYILTFLRSDLILTCHHTCKLYSIYMILELTVVHHSMYKMCMSKNNHVNHEPVLCLIYHISNMYDFEVFFGWWTSIHVYRGVVTGICKHIFRNVLQHTVIYHIFEGSFISFWIILLPYSNQNHHPKIVEFHVLLMINGWYKSHPV